MPDTLAPAAPASQAIGANQPPDPIAELQAELAKTQEPLIKRAQELVAALDRAPAVIEDAEWANKIADTIKLIQACSKNAEAARVDKKEPFLAGGRAVDGFFKTTITDPLARVQKTLTDRLTVWQRKVADEERKRREEEAKRQQEEADRLAKAAAAAAETMTTETDLCQAVAVEKEAQQAVVNAEVAQQAVDAKPAELSRSRSAIGSVASLRTFWDFKDLDRGKIDLEALRPYLATADIEKAVRGYVKANFASGRPGQQIAGVTIFENTSSQVR